MEGVGCLLPLGDVADRSFNGDRHAPVADWPEDVLRPEFAPVAMVHPDGDVCVWFDGRVVEGIEGGPVVGSHEVAEKAGVGIERTRLIPRQPPDCRRDVFVLAVRKQSQAKDGLGGSLLGEAGT